MLKSTGADDALSKDSSSVVRTEVNQGDLGAINEQPCMMTGGCPIGEAQRTVIGSTDKQFTRWWQWAQE